MNENSPDAPAIIAPTEADVAKVSAWGDDEREHRSDVERPEPPPWLAAFSNGARLMHGGWWCDVLSVAPIRLPSGDTRWLCLIEPIEMTAKERKRIGAKAPNARETARAARMLREMQDEHAQCMDAIEAAERDAQSGDDDEAKS